MYYGAIGGGPAFEVANETAKEFEEATGYFSSTSGKVLSK